METPMITLLSVPGVVASVAIGLPVVSLLQLVTPVGEVAVEGVAVPAFSWTVNHKVSISESSPLYTEIRKRPKNGGED